MGNCKGCTDEGKIILKGFKRLGYDPGEYIDKIEICAVCDNADKGYCTESGLFIPRIITNEYCGKWEKEYISE